MNEIVSSFSSITWFILIASGILSILSFGERLASVLEKENFTEWLKFASIFGFIFGVFSLIVTAFNLIGPHLTPAITGGQTEWDVLLIGLAIGAALALKPIKDMKWASLVSLSGGIGIMILIWMMFPSAPSTLLIIAGVISLLLLYLALKFIEDFYLLISSVVTSPPISVGLGVLALLEGVLLLFNSSILFLLTGN